MADNSLKHLLEQMLSDSNRAQEQFAAEQARYRKVAAGQKRQLAVGRLKIDAARAVLEQRVTKGTSGKAPS
jgi:hypothetical protein